MADRTEVLYWRVPASVSEELDQWVRDTGMPKTDLVTEFVKQGMSRPPVVLVRLRSLTLQLEGEPVAAVS